MRCEVKLHCTLTHCFDQALTDFNNDDDGEGNGDGLKRDNSGQMDKSKKSFELFKMVVHGALIRLRSVGCNAILLKQLTMGQGQPPLLDIVETANENKHIEIDYYFISI